jgi:dihydrofolate reductase
VGRKSFEILGGPLPGRPTIVLTRQENYPLPTNVRKASTLAQALEMVRGKKKVFVIGGTEPYREAIEAGFATHLVLTRVHGTFEGDAFFPEFDTSKWKLTESKFRPRDEKNAYDMTFEVWERA